MANDELLSFSFNAVLHNYVEDIESTVFEEECACVEFLLNMSPSVDVLGFVWDDQVHAVKKHDVQFRLDKSLMVSEFFFFAFLQFLSCIIGIHIQFYVLI